MMGPILPEVGRDASGWGILRDAPDEIRSTPGGFGDHDADGPCRPFTLCLLQLGALAEPHLPRRSASSAVLNCSFSVEAPFARAY